MSKRRHPANTAHVHRHFSAAHLPIRLIQLADLGRVEALEMATLQHPGGHRCLQACPAARPRPRFPQREGKLQGLGCASWRLDPHVQLTSAIPIPSAGTLQGKALVLFNVRSFALSLCYSAICTPQIRKAAAGTP